MLSCWLKLTGAVTLVTGATEAAAPRQAKRAVKPKMKVDVCFMLIRQIGSKLTKLN